MPGSGSSFFTYPDGYAASLPGWFDLVVPRLRDFHARLTWVELPHLKLLRAREVAPRVAYVALPQDLVFVTFPTERNSLLIHDGAELRFGDVMFHTPGEWLHQRTIAASRWGSVSLTPASLKAFGRAIAGEDVVAPEAGRLLRPGRANRQRLLRLHAQAGRIAETDPERIGHQEVIRALEQDLIVALLNCLTGDDLEVVAQTARHRPGILLRFEAMVAANPGKLLRARDVCAAIGISPRTLSAACAESLGMSPGRYQRLRRLKHVRTELLRAETATVSIAEIVARYGFADVHRFVTEYRKAYGEPPPPRREAER